MLVILETGVDYEIEHPKDCPVEEIYTGGHPGDGPVIDYRCLTGYMIANAGLKDNGVEWERLPVGRYRLIAEAGWIPSLPTNDGREWEASLDLGEKL